MVVPGPLKQVSRLRFGARRQLQWLVGAGLALLVGIAGVAVQSRFGDQHAVETLRQAEPQVSIIPPGSTLADRLAAPNVELAPAVVALSPAPPPSQEASLPEPEPAPPNPVETSTPAAPSPVLAEPAGAPESGAAPVREAASSVELTPPVAALPPALPLSQQASLPEPAPPNPMETGTPAAPSLPEPEPAGAPLAEGHPDLQGGAAPATNAPAHGLEAVPGRSIRPRVSTRLPAHRRPGSEARSDAAARPLRPTAQPAKAGLLEPEERRSIRQRLARPKSAAPPAARLRLAERLGAKDATASLPRSPQRSQPSRSPVESRAVESKPRPFTLPADLRPSGP
jgi:hypothetical protein